MKFVLPVCHYIRKPLLTHRKLLLRFFYRRIIRTFFVFILLWNILIGKLYQFTIHFGANLNRRNLRKFGLRRLLSWNGFTLLFLKNLFYIFVCFYWSFTTFVHRLQIRFIILIFTLIYVFLIEILLMMLQNLLCFFLVLNTTSRYFVRHNELNLTGFVIKWFFLLNLIVVLRYCPSMRFANHTRFFSLLSLISQNSISFLNLWLTIVYFYLNGI